MGLAGKLQNNRNREKNRYKTKLGLARIEEIERERWCFWDLCERERDVARISGHCAFSAERHLLFFWFLSSSFIEKIAFLEGLLLSLHSLSLSTPIADWGLTMPFHSLPSLSLLWLSSTKYLLFTRNFSLEKGSARISPFSQFASSSLSLLLFWFFFSKSERKREKSFNFFFWGTFNFRCFLSH